MASTPPPPSGRARTPPTPRHGPRFDDYEPFSPRRSTRVTAHSNPYSSFNGERDHTDVVTPSNINRKHGFVRAPTQLSSPPSSPVSPVRQRMSRAIHKTPRQPKYKAGVRDIHMTGTQSDSDGPSTFLSGARMPPGTMLPTPAKTPRKRTAVVSSTARILNFQPDDPNDVMPARRRMHKNGRGTRMSGLEVYEDDGPHDGDKIEIYTDPNARIPEFDGGDDNPFIGESHATRRPQRKSARTSRVASASDARIDEAVRRGEGVAYVFRGKKIFRRFEQDDGDVVDDDEGLGSNDGADISSSPGQRNLRKQAGASAERPLTRSAIQPRLLFPSAEQLRAREAAKAEEEAVTDVDMPSGEIATGDESDTAMATPVNERFAKSFTPPTTVRRSTRSRAAPVCEVQKNAMDEEMLPTDASTSHRKAAAAAAAPHLATNGRKHSPFDSWPRTKAGKRRASNEAVKPTVGASNAKRAKSVAVESPGGVP